MTTNDTHHAIETVWRIERAKIIAGLTRARCVISALPRSSRRRRWSRHSGIGRSRASRAIPPAWLMVAGKRRAIDHFRRAKDARAQARRTRPRDGSSSRSSAVPDIDSASTTTSATISSLIFTACHPLLSPEARIALTLRLLGGLTTEEIARAFLVAGTDHRSAHRAGQAHAGRCACSVRGSAWGRIAPPALSSVLEFLYLIFNEGYAATAGDDWIRPQLCEEAMRLGRILAGLAPNEPEVHGLRRADGNPGFAAEARGLARRENLSCCSTRTARAGTTSLSAVASPRSTRARGTRAGARGPYTLQAAIAACHARARTADGTDWPCIAALYQALAFRSRPRPSSSSTARSPCRWHSARRQVSNSRISSFRNRRFEKYHLLPSVRGDLLWPSSAAWKKRGSSSSGSGGAYPQRTGTRPARLPAPPPAPMASAASR